tara:strand:- start:3796 stop:4293 length:498 start_codon:yes stop_codon:yes gene_type:complete
MARKKPTGSQTTPTANKAETETKAPTTEVGAGADPMPTSQKDASTAPEAGTAPVGAGVGGETSDAPIGAGVDPIPKVNPEATGISNAKLKDAIQQATREPDSDEFGPEGFNVIVVGPQRGRYRVGRHFTNKPVIIPATELNEVEIERLANDPLLNVEIKPIVPEA